MGEITMKKTELSVKEREYLIAGYGALKSLNMNVGAAFLKFVLDNDETSLKETHKTRLSKSNTLKGNKRAKEKGEQK